MAEPARPLSQRMVGGATDDLEAGGFRFRLLEWRSQQTDTKLRLFAARLVVELSTARADLGSLRRALDHLVSTAHQRVVPR